MRRPTPFAVEQFEYVDASAETALLRVAGRWRDGDPGDCMLVARRGLRQARFTALPQLPATDATEPWRGAYSAPLEVVRDGRVRFELRSKAFGRVRLPRPRERGAKQPAPESEAAARARRQAFEGERAHLPRA